MTKLQVLDVYFATTLDTEALLRNSIMSDGMEPLEKPLPLSPYAQSTIEETQGCMAWVKKGLQSITG